jgi:magnesium transporter
MVRYLIKEDGRLRELDEPVSSCWINIEPPFTHEELEELALNYDIPLDFLTDSLDIDERSRYEREEDVRLILLNTPVLNGEKEENDAVYITVPVGIILIPDHFITISSFENPVLQLFLDNKIKHFNPSDESAFVLQIMEQNVYRFLTCLKKLNLRRNLIEQELYDSSRNKELVELLSIEKSLVYFMNSLSANELLKMKMKRTDFLQIRDDEDKADLFEDIIIDNSQALEMANVYTNILNGTMDAYGSIISNNLNLTIRRLTLITIILMVPTLIASFYGMNVPLPAEKSPYTSLGIIGVSILLSLLVTWYFQRKRMF